MSLTDRPLFTDRIKLANGIHVFIRSTEDIKCIVVDNGSATEVFSWGKWIIFYDSPFDLIQIKNFGMLMIIVAANC